MNNYPMNKKACDHCSHCVLLRTGFGTDGIHCTCERPGNDVIELTMADIRNGCSWFSLGTPEIRLKD